jgi:cupin fold WbuC family metalloprotein
VPQPVQLLSAALIADLRGRAAASARGRTNHNFHASAGDAVHRFLNVLTRGTYVQPHRHVNPPKHESFIVLEGRVAAISFDDEGAVRERWVLGGEGSELRGIDLPGGLWHTITALSEYAVCYEVKPGPWDAATDKEFAPWAPVESDAAAARAWLETLLESTCSF